MKKTLAAIAAAVDLYDVVFVVGLGLLAAGCFAVYWPLGLIVPILTGLGIYAAQRGPRSPRPPEGVNDGTGLSYADA
jgi:hypothetical protein